MGISVDIPTRKDIEDMVELKIRRMEKDFYHQLQKLKNQVTDLNDIIRILKRE